MEIGEKLKKAHTDMGLTQEKVAAEIGVSRQSVSNWENNRAYPDIVSVIKLSDLYSVSLDELLKEDKKMIRHLAESTDTVASHKRLTKRILIGVYWGFWLLMILLFWLVYNPLVTNEYFLPHGWTVRQTIIFHVAFPVCMFVITLVIGAANGFGRLRWLYVPATGGMFLLFDMLTWYLDLFLWSCGALGVPFNPFELIRSFLMDSSGDELLILFIGLGCSAFGILIGSLIRLSRIAKAKQADDKAFSQENSPM